MKGGSRIVSGLIMITVNVLILLYVLNLEKENCECSKSWKRDFIKYFSMILIASNLFTMVVPNLNKLVLGKLVMVLFGLLSLANIVHLGVLISYYYDLRKLIKDGCSCADSWQKHLLVVPLALFAVLVVLLLTVNILSKSVKK